MKYFRNISAASPNPNIGTPTEPKVYNDVSEKYIFRKKSAWAASDTFVKDLKKFYSKYSPVASTHVRKYGNRDIEGNRYGTQLVKKFESKDGWTLETVMNNDSSIF